MEQFDELLSKYSYPIFTFSGNTQHSATAFFFVENDIAYLVSNYHSIKGMSPMHNRQIWKSDILYLKISNPNNNEFQIVSIDISEEITGQTEIFYMENRIDLFKVKINIQNLHINFINDLINPLYFNSIPKKVLVYGYPNPDEIQDKFWSKISKFESQYNIDGFDNFYSGTLRNMPRFNEKERMYAVNRFYYFINGMIAGGYSGAPIIGEFENEKNEKVYHFFGVNFGNEPFSNQTWAIRGDKALEYMIN